MVTVEKKGTEGGRVGKRLPYSGRDDEGLNRRSSREGREETNLRRLSSN